MNDALKTFGEEIRRRRAASAAAAERHARDADANRGAVLACDELLAKLDAQLRTGSAGPEHCAESDEPPN